MGTWKFSSVHTCKLWDSQLLAGGDQGEEGAFCLDPKAKPPTGCSAFPTNRDLGSPPCSRDLRWE